MVIFGALDVSFKVKRKKHPSTIMWGDLFQLGCALKLIFSMSSAIFNSVPIAPIVYKSPLKDINHVKNMENS
jgi:hypothetical protein